MKEIMEEINDKYNIEFREECLMNAKKLFEVLYQTEPTLDELIKLTAFLLTEKFIYYEKENEEE